MAVVLDQLLLPSKQQHQYSFSNYPAVEWQQAEAQNDNPELTALSCFGSGIAGWTRIIETINGSDTKQAAYAH